MNNVFTLKNISIKKFIELKKNMDDKDYLISSILYNIAPTLARKKPASLMSFTMDKRGLYRLWENHKKDLLMESKVGVFEIKNDGDNALVLFYDQSDLIKSLSNEENRKFLKANGYHDDMSIEEALDLLKKRFEKGCPHEIGIFLGYPLEDVLGFIEHKGKNCLMCRYWKVYNNPERAINCFRDYDRAKIKVLNLIARGEEPFTLLCSYSN